jgi:hypothetical protein
VCAGGEAPAAAFAAAVGGSLVAWPLKAMIPMYIYPTYLGSFWNVIEANPTNVEYVIANVETGPGTSANSDYTTHIDNCRAVGRSTTCPLCGAASRGDQLSFSAGSRSASIPTLRRSCSVCA